MSTITPTRKQAQEQNPKAGTETSASTQKTGKTGESAGTKTKLGWIIAIYLLGIFMGALDTGIITPARTVIQGDLGVSSSAGIWMITIYTLAYAASIPIMGKLADRMGRRRIYLISIALFTAGSAACGLAQDFSSFEMLIAARAVQALGGGGILPIATAAFGTELPKERRGLAFGLIGMVYGVANLFGASAGSAILDLVGTANWQWIFYVNVPIGIFIFIAGARYLRRETPGETPLEGQPEASGQAQLETAAGEKKLDLSGAFVLVAIILSLLYALGEINFTTPLDSLTQPSTLALLILALVLVPVLVWIEKRVADPVLNLHYFTSAPILGVLVLSMLSGAIMMGVIFVPQFAENSLLVAPGKGGYFVIILALASGVGAPLSGRLIDRFGPKPVLGFGLAGSAIAGLYIIFEVSVAPSTFNVIIALIGLGLGLGFTIGSSLNYMILDHTKEQESNSALATLSLVRSIGTTIAPALMVACLASAGTNIQNGVMDTLSSEIKISAMGQEVPLKDMLGDAKAEIPADLVEKLANADATSITDVSKELAEQMLEQQSRAGGNLEKMASMNPQVWQEIKTNISQQIEQLRPQLQNVFRDRLNEGFARLYWLYTVFSLASLIILVFIPKSGKARNSRPEAGADKFK